MKKILISVLIILLLILSYFAFAKGIRFLNIKRLNNIKEANTKLQNDFNEANELSNRTYPLEVEGLEEAIKELKISKQEYENKKLYGTEENSIGALEVKTYKIHYLWTILGNYRKDRGVQSLNLDLKSTESADVYDLEFTLIGTYTSITDFLYDIENDEELNFEVKNFLISSQIGTTVENNTDTENTGDTNSENSISEEKNTNEEEPVTKTDGINLQAKFTVENIGITLD